MLDAVSGFATLVWFPTGISLAALLIWGVRFWPAITLGAILANSQNGASPLIASGISLGNTLEAVIGAYLLNISGFNKSLERVKDVLTLIVLAAVLSTLISATIGVSSLWLGRVITLSNFDETLLAWWIGDLTSDLVVAPLILVWANRLRVNIKIRSKDFLEFLALAFSTVIIVIFIFGRFFTLEPYLSPRAYISFPILIWAALRFGPAGATATTFILSVAAVWLTYLGVGPFISNALHQSLFSVQVYMSIMSVSAMILAAIASEKKELEERKDEFISVASHELKTPLTTIKGYTQILKQTISKSSSEKLFSYLGKMEEQINRLTKLVNDLLNVSKIQAGKLSLQKARFDINELVKDIILDMQLSNKKYHILFEGKSKMEKVWADKIRISEVLINLISNAIKYSPKANKIVVRTSPNNNQVVISIQDFGIGISKKDKDRIFQRFFQAETRIRQSFQGLGLGLYISSEIIKSHRGQIWIDSIKGKGTTVSFSLPLR